MTGSPVEPDPVNPGSAPGPRDEAGLSDTSPGSAADPGAAASPGTAVSSGGTRRPDDEPAVAPVSSRRTRRVVLGAALLLLVVLVAGGVALATTTGDGNRGGNGSDTSGEAGDRPTTGGGPTASNPATSAPAATGAPATGRPSFVLPPAEGGTPVPTPPDDAYRAVPQLCEEADFAPVFDLLPQVELLGDDEVAGPTVYQRFCTYRLEEAGSAGTLRVDVSVYSSADEAQGWFDQTLETEARGEPHEEFTANAGVWDDTAVLAFADESDQADVWLLARDEALVVNLSHFIVGSAADEQAQREALIEVAGQIRDRMRA